MSDHPFASLTVLTVTFHRKRTALGLGEVTTVEVLEPASRTPQVYPIEPLKVPTVGVQFLPGFGG